LKRWFRVKPRYLLAAVIVASVPTVCLGQPKPKAAPPDAPATPSPALGSLASPRWSTGTNSHVEVVAEGAGTLHGTWEPVDGSAGYALEVATDDGFNRVVSHAESADPADRAFHIDKVGPGTYFLRVRARDKDGHPGLESETLEIAVVEVGFARGTGKVEKSISTIPTASLHFSSVSGVELALRGDKLDGKFVPIPETVDLTTTHPSRIAFRIGGEHGPATEVPIEYARVTADINLTRSRATQEGKLTVTLHGAETPEAAKALKPRARIHRGEAAEKVALDPVNTGTGDPTFVTTVESPGEVTKIEIVDVDGNVLGAAAPGAEGPSKKDEPPPPPDDRSRIGVMSPPFTLGPYGPPQWWAPTAANAGSVGPVVESDFHGGPTDVSGRLLVSGLIGPVGFDVTLRADAFRHLRASDPGGWIGARVRVTGGKKGSIEFAPMLRVGFPITKFSYPARIEGGFAVGQEIGPWSWLVDAGTRFQLQYNALGAFTMPVYVVGGGTYQIVSWLRAEAVLDAEVALDSTKMPCVLCMDDSAHPSGGISVGFEGGTTIFGSLVGRISPFAAKYGNISADAAIGVRASP
jgi:hypothetical protein